MNNFEKASTVKEISLVLDVGTSTLRKWCLALEENGYSFHRTEKNNRLFLEHDLVALKYFKELVQDKQFTLKNASNVVTSRFKGEFTEGEASESRTPNNDLLTSSSKRSDEILEELLEKSKKQDEFNQEILSLNQRLVEKLDAQHRYIEDSIKKRDELLMQTIKENLETRKLIAAAREEEESKKGFFAKLFKRK